jgi:hypothetical protein
MGTPSPNLPIGIFFLLTIPYFIFQYKTKEQYGIGIFVIYILLLILIQIWISIQLTSSICGSIQVGPAFIATIFPWLLIFGILNIVIAVFPGWLIPFSNTFGYGIAKLSGLRKLLDEHILKSKEITGNTDLSKTLGIIYDDPSLIINEIPNTDAGFSNFWEKFESGKLLQEGANKYKDELRQLVRLKGIIAQFIWFSLAGVLTASTSYSYLISSGCKSSVAEMQQRHTEYERSLESDTVDDAEQARVYTNRGT